MSSRGYKRGHVSHSRLSYDSNSNDTAFELSEHIDPQKLGSGIWFMIHLHALSYDKRKISTNAMKPAEFIRWLCEYHPCSECAEHCSQYIEENPPEKYESRPIHLSNGKTTYYSSFFWTWKFHNSVNLQIGKPRISFKHALLIYEHLMTGDKCEKSCSISH